MVEEPLADFYSRPSRLACLQERTISKEKSRNRVQKPVFVLPPRLPLLAKAHRTKAAKSASYQRRKPQTWISNLDLNSPSFSKNRNICTKFESCTHSIRTHRQNCGSRLNSTRNHHFKMPFRSSSIQSRLLDHDENEINNILPKLPSFFKQQPSTAADASFPEHRKMPFLSTINIAIFVTLVLCTLLVWIAKASASK